MRNPARPGGGAIDYGIFGGCGCKSRSRTPPPPSDRVSRLTGASKLSPCVTFAVVMISKKKLFCLGVLCFIFINVVSFNIFSSQTLMDMKAVSVDA